jgi:carbonic anhydrase
MKVKGSRLSKLVIGGAILLWSMLSLAAGGVSGVTADEALQRLLDGNKRYMESKMKACGETNAAAREKLARTQKPYAIILSCSDSRVPPEIIFDKGLGEIFVVRVAGNIPDPIIVGSIEYAVEHLGSTLVMVLGHQRCGAVIAAVDAKGKPVGNIGAIMKVITPAVNQAKAEYKGKEKAELVETAINDNVKLVTANLTKQSSILNHFVKEGKVKIVPAKYDLDDGKVTLLEMKN